MSCNDRYCNNLVLSGGSLANKGISVQVSGILMLASLILLSHLMARHRHPIKIYILFVV